jgi:hypothetical protein
MKDKIADFEKQLLSNQTKHLQEIQQKVSKIELGMLVTVWPFDFESPILVLVVKADDQTSTNNYFCLVNEKLISFNIKDIFLDGETPVKSFAGFAMPILRRVFPSLIAPNIISVQPLTAPSSMIFHTEFLKQGKTKK